MRRVLHVAVLAGVLGAACGSTKSAAPERDEPSPVPEAAPEAALARDDGPLAGSRQLIVGITPAWNSPDVTLAVYERDADGDDWRPVGQPWSGTVGAAGVGWGRGLHGDGPPPDRPGPTKVEGDRRSPAGVFALLSAYGYAESNVSGAALPYDQVTASWRCVDDSESPDYNRVFNAEGRDATWGSAEHMRRTDAQYEWVIEIGHNPSAVPMGGSCIFFHVWSGEGAPTVGCTAMPKPDIEALMARIDPDAAPRYVLLPAAEHEALRAAWHLP